MLFVADSSQKTLVSLPQQHNEFKMSTVNIWHL